MMMALILMTLLRKIWRLNFSIVYRYLSSFGFNVRTAARKVLQTWKVSPEQSGHEIQNNETHQNDTQ